MNQIRKPAWISCELKKTNIARCMFISSTRSSPTVESQSLHILMSFSFTFCIDILHLCRINLWMLCFLVCHVCLRVTMTSSTQDKITGYFPQALIWIRNVFVYHTCKKVCFTYEYVIKRYIFTSCDVTWSAYNILVS